MTTVGKLATAVCQYQDRQRKRNARLPFTSFDAVVADVTYVDPNDAGPIYVDSEALLLYKRNAYAHEREVRLVINHSLPLSIPTGWWLPVCLQEFVDRVIVAPGAGQALIAAVTDLTQSRGQSSIRVVQSSLDNAPDWDCIARQANKDLEEYWETTSKYKILFPPLLPGDVDSEPPQKLDGMWDSWYAKRNEGHFGQS